MKLVTLAKAQSITRNMKLILATVLIVGSAPMVSLTNASENAEAFVRNLVNESYRILDEKTLSDSERNEQFHKLLNSASDLRRTAVFTLGSYIHKAKPSDVENFFQVYEGFIVRTLQAHLMELSDRALMVTGSTDRADDDSVVSIKVVNPNGNSRTDFQGAFRVRTDARGALAITDIQFEGVWLAIHQRADFTSYLQRNFGDVSGLSNHLDKRAREIPITGENMS